MDGSPHDAAVIMRSPAHLGLLNETESTHPKCPITEPAVAAGATWSKPT